jgi:cephalosporin-C deacetylase-like acetyl esterase
MQKYILLLGLILGTFGSGLADFIDLQDTWLFHTGDDLAWRQMDFPDSSWEYIGFPQVWETAGFSNYSGYAWYRKTVFIPEAWQFDQFVQLKNSLVLELGHIDDVEQTFFNEHLIGQTGGFPPHFQAPQTSFRQYKIPLDQVRWGAENLIAIRVYDAEENGGFYAGQPRLRTPSIIDDCTVELELDQMQHVYRMGEPVFAWVSIQNNSTESLAASLEFTLKSVRGTIVDQSQQAVEVLPGKSRRTQIRFRARIPDYYQLWLRILDAEELVFETHRNLGYNLEQLNAAPTAEADFAEFWARTRKQLDLIPLQTQIERIDSLEILNRHVFRVRLLSFDNVYIYGWYLVPKGRGNFPTILNIHNQPFIYNSRMERLFPEFALFLLDVRGFGSSRSEVDPGNPGYFVWNISDKEKYFCRGAILDCIRAVDFLTSRSEVDTSRLGVIGNGLGGGLALAAAALDSRVKAVAADSPLLMALDVVTKLTILPYHEIVQYLIAHPSEKKEIFKTLSYYDLINLAPLIRTPVLMSVMLEDRISPPISAAIVYNRIQGDKMQKFYPRAGHGFTSNAHETMKAEWIKQQLKIK